MPQIGVLAVQGDFEKHLEAFVRAGVAPSDLREVRVQEDLDAVDRLVIPGGESTTVGLLLQRFGLGEAIQARAQDGMPIWGTCMGMIMLANRVEGRDQWTLGLLDITVKRNAFGAQVHSFEDAVEVKGLDEPVMGVFIRAPIVTAYGSGVDVLSTYEDKVVAVRQGHLLGTSFHPELTTDTRLHEWFLTF
ncbi:MAG: pyridoxal 5'-phosphate synthase glutaminase subunit PdxT [Armatimonadetes bacterium]|nr:pyridoxal 5'-phosphate synthase glutaminase subunit PdxT [Armatimonadota bacterium]